MSIGQLIGTDELTALTDELVAARVPVNSYGVGPRIDAQLLAVLANQTGGVLALDRDDLSAEEAGGFLAQAAVEPVVWPERVTLPAVLDEAFPQRMPPLRADRDSVVVGSGSAREAFEVTVSGLVGGAATEMSWVVEPRGDQQENAYLASIVEAARQDGGQSLPTLGTAGLRELQRVFAQQVDGLGALGRHAVVLGQLDDAERLADAADELEPGNAASEVIRGAAARVQTGEAEVGLRLAQRDDAPLGEGEGPLAEDGGFVGAVETEQRVRAQLMEAVVQNAINDARSLMDTDPQVALERLKLVHEEVRQAVELDAEVRLQLLRKLEDAMRQGTQRADEFVERTIRAQAVEAAARDRQRATEALYLRDEKIEQMIVRFNTLMDEGFFKSARQVAEVAREETEGSVAPTVVTEQAVADASMVGAVTTALALREARQFGYLDALESVERSFVPISDEPPIVYPPAEVWRRITESRKQYASVDLASTNPAEQKIVKELDEPTDIEFIDTPLEDVLAFLEDYHEIEIELNRRALDDFGIDSGAPITRTLQGVSLRSALKLILEDMDLTYVIDNEVLLITTVEDAEQRLVTKVYPVADLVVPIQAFGVGGGFGGGGFGGGGGGGGFGGGGGGFGGGGGGFGGGGGGFGGGGGGFGGGGNFNVRDNLFPLPQGGGFRAFAVEEDGLTLSSDSQRTRPSQPAQRVAEPQAAADTPQETPHSQRDGYIRLTIKEGADVAAAWDAYFAEFDAAPEVIGETARRLMSDRQFEHVSALLLAAVRHGHAQPWMYEGLALAMQAEGREPQEIERVLMSAADFAQSNLDLLHLATYFARSGLEARALKLFRTVSQAAPARLQPYALGLQVASRIDDVDGVMWATCGILSQAVPEKKVDVWKAAYRIAESTLARLEAEGQSEKAAQYKAQLDEAVVRDCVVIVSWTGEADVDVLVEEPAGTICSFHDPQTTSGGVLMGDSLPQVGASAPGGYSEAYVCPQAFSGEYRVLVRRVWGDVAADRVTVDIYTNYSGPNATHLRQQIPLGEKDALVTFELADGRRQDALEAHQLAAAANQQLAAGQQVLNQQLAIVSDPAALAGLVSGRDPGNRVLPRIGGAVGFQPVITVLPEGTNLIATAVISADRRYVRYSGVPLFSAVTEVNTFNLATGANQTGQGGTGGQGFGGGVGAGFGGGGGGNNF